MLLILLSNRCNLPGATDASMAAGTCFVPQGTAECAGTQDHTVPSDSPGLSCLPLLGDKQQGPGPCIHEYSSTLHISRGQHPPSIRTMMAGCPRICNNSAENCRHLLWPDEGQLSLLAPALGTAHDRILWYIVCTLPVTVVALSKLIVQLRTAECRALAEEDEAANGQGGPIEETVGPSGQELYQRGSFASSPHKTMPAYLTRSAGMFMDVAEGLVNNHLRNEDLYSGLITSEWYVLDASFMHDPRMYVSHNWAKPGPDKNLNHQ